MKSLEKKPDQSLDIKKGDRVIDDDGRVLIVTGFKKNGNIDIGFEDGSHYGDIEPKRFSHEYLRIDKPIEELEREAIESLHDLSKLKEEYGFDDSRALVSTEDPNQLLSVKTRLELMERRAEIFKRIIEGKKDELSNIVSNFREIIGKINKVIGVFELYLGINEEIIQIQEGEPVRADVPINFRQQILFMDEELGDPSDKGLDFKRIEDFDAWLLKEANYKKLIPEPKGVVVLRVRRHMKDYGYGNSWGGWMLQAFCDGENSKTYVLLRNGENIYRIWADIVIEPRLFPGKTEFEDLIKKDKESAWGHDEEKIQARVFSYKQNALMLQGLIDRTSVFHPIKPDINIFKTETWAGTIRFIYDDELKLTGGEKYWKDWKESINEKIDIGSRIFICDNISFESAKYLSADRTDYRYHRCGFVPAPGIYKILTSETDKKGNKTCKIMMHPKRTVYPWDYNKSMYETERGIGFLIYPGDSFVLNYDMISLADVEYYINSRIDRENYLNMIPILWGIKKLRLQEIEWEKGFVELVAGRNNVPKEKVWEAIEWWKYKNKWKRPLREDDAKALRMVEKHLKKGKQ